MPSVTFEKHSGGIPPIKLDGKVYVVLQGTYQRLLNEKQITARYTSSGGIDLQKQNTGKHRWMMTLIVPVSTSYLVLTHSPISASDFGTLADLQASDDKVAPSSQLQLYDIENDWDFSGSYNYLVYIDKMENAQPYQNDIYKWQVPISLWGEDA